MYIHVRICNRGCDLNPNYKPRTKFLNKAVCPVDPVLNQFIKSLHMNVFM